MFSLLKNREYKDLTGQRLNNAATDGLYFLQRLKLDKKLCVHDGCVNTISWNESGTLILSGSDDQHLAITNPFSGKNIVKFRSGHRSNIFSAKFLPGSLDKEVVSCSGSGEIFYTDVEREDTYGANRFDCHFGTTYKLLVVPNEAATFLSCGDDGTVRFFDLRTKTSCSKFNCEEDVVIHLRNAVTAMAVDPVIPFQLAVASSDGMVRLYDRRMLKARETGGNNASLICKFPPPIAGGEKRPYRITSLNYRQGSHDVLVNYSSENIYLFNTYETTRQQCYSARLGQSDGSTSKPVAMTSQSAKNEGGAGPSDGAIGCVTASADNGSDSESAFKPIKRLRLRGDWSDTGPDARPESEEPALTNTIMQRMSDLLTRMLNSRGDRSEGQEGAEGEEEEEVVDRNQLGHELELQEGGVRDETATSTASDAASVLRSVMFRSASAAAVRRIWNEDNPARYSISSEGLVSPELSSVEMDSGSQGEAPSADNEIQTSQNEVANDVNKINSELDSKEVSLDSEHRALKLSKSGQKQDQSPHGGPAQETDGDATVIRQSDQISTANDSSHQSNETSCFQKLKSETEAQSPSSACDYEYVTKAFTETENNVEGFSSDNASKSDNIFDGIGDQNCDKMDIRDSAIQQSEEEVETGNIFKLHNDQANRSGAKLDNPVDSDKALCGASEILSSTQGKTSATDQGMEVDQKFVGSPMLESVTNSVNITKSHVTNKRQKHLKKHLSMESNSESNDSISEQMSANLHIQSTLSGRISDVSKDSQDDEESKQCQFSNQNIQSVSKKQPFTTGYVQLEEQSHILQSISTDQSSMLASPRTAESSNKISVGDPTNQAEIQPTNSAENSSPTASKLNSFTSSPSWSESTVAIADGTLSNCEGSNSQRTLNDITGFTAMSSINSSAIPSFTEVTPTLTYSRDSAKNLSISEAAEQLITSDLDQGKINEDRDIDLTGMILKKDRESSVSPSHQISDFKSTYLSQPKVDNENTMGQNGPDREKYPSRPVLGVFTSESSNIVETAMVIPHVCKSCGDEFAVRVEDMDCGQVQKRMKTGLCPQCFRKGQDGDRSTHDNLQTAANSFDKEAKDIAEVMTAEEFLDNEEEFLMPRKENRRNIECNKVKDQAIVGKGKGIGKSSARAKKLAEEKESSFAPYNSGKMKISSQGERQTEILKSRGMSSSKNTGAPATDLKNTKAESGNETLCDSSSSSGGEYFPFAQSQEPSTSYGTKPPVFQENATRAAPLPGFRLSSQGSERQRRTGYSLPPTGNFQLHGDDDDEEDDENNEHANNKRKINLDRERMSRAAQKIQEVYRKKREAKEMAKMMEVPEPRVLMKYSGHRNCRTMIKEANFFGDHYVISGSDCGRILAWERETGQMVMYMDADKHVVNCVQPNLYLPILASSGIDYDIKIWSPLEEEPQFDEEFAEMIIRRNKLMLEETRDTVTVPAAFMLRILASLSQIRTGRNSRGQGAQVSSGQE